MPATKYAFTYFAPRSPLPKWRGDLKSYAAKHAQQTTPTETLGVASLKALRKWVRERVCADGRKGDAGYIVAGVCAGERRGDCVGPAAFALIDYDGAEPDWEALDAYAGFAWTTASHVDDTHPAWRVVIPFREPVAHGKLTCPFVGAHIRNRSQPAFLPTGPDVQWRELAGRKRLDASAVARSGGPTSKSKRTRSAPNPERRSLLAKAPKERRGKVEGGAQFPFDSPPDLSALARHVPPSGVDGDRHLLVRALGGWLGRRGYSPEAIAEAVRLQIPTSDPEERAAQAQDAAERVRAGLEAPGWEALNEWAQRYAKGPSTLRRLERACRDPREPAEFGDVWSEWWAGFLPKFEARLAAARATRPRTVTDGAEAVDLPGGHGELDGTGLHLHPSTGWPWILQRDGTFWLHRVSEKTYHPEIRASELEASVARDLAGLVSEEDRTPTALRGAWIKPLRSLRSTYVARVHTYEPDTRTLTLAALQWTERAAKHHAHIDRWLRALFGAGYDAAAQWLAAVVALDRPTPCLYLPGPRELGKSLLADGLAALWTRPAPVEMGEAIDAFNEATAECPLVFTDEGFPDGMSFSAFRRMITAHSRRVNVKYRAKYEVEGCARFMVAANNEDVLRYQKIGTLTRDDLEAIADRLLVVPCHVEARDELRTWGVDVLNQAAQGEIAEHVLWLAETVELEPSGRMAARPGGGERILAGVVAGRSAEVLARIREAIGTGAMGEKSGVRVPKAAREEVWVNVRRLMSTFDGRVALGAVGECCDSFALRPGTEQHKSADGENLRWRVLSRLRLDEAFAKLD